MLALKESTICVWSDGGALCWGSAGIYRPISLASLTLTVLLCFHLAKDPDLARPDHLKLCSVGNFEPLNMNEYESTV